ncbi:MAG: DUF1858 domain-containing protein [Clostridia bacterium]|nr:DUF1858 domain-containing protein [Clostridia bacterium]
MIVTKDTVIGDILDANKEVSVYFLEMGMHCLECPCSRAETIAEACAAHGTDADALIAKINAFLSK